MIEHNQISCPEDIFSGGWSAISCSSAWINTWKPERKRRPQSIQVFVLSRMDYHIIIWKSSIIYWGNHYQSLLTRWSDKSTKIQMVYVWTHLSSIQLMETKDWTEELSSNYFSKNNPYKWNFLIDIFAILPPKLEIVYNMMTSRMWKRK